LTDDTLSGIGNRNKANRIEEQRIMQVKALLDKKGQPGVIVQIALEFHAFGN
jgi:hypothetical protein